ncbi:MAG TPA: acyl-CoA dehydrogenase family protein [Steroidobacteraceae bacterium]|nr:acyl-CoA dehydrogenase family protein [Steroidobacteraceae bacterium]
MTIELITASARKLFEREFDLGFMRRYRASHEPDTDRLVRLCQEMGWHGLVIREAQGGFGYEFDALCALLQELGRAAFPGLYFSHFVAPVLLLDALADSPAASRASEAIADCSVIPIVATGTATVEAFAGVDSFRLEEGAEGARVTGRAGFVCDVGSANVLFVPALRSDGAIALHAIEKGRSGVSIGEQADHAYGRTFSVTCTDVSVGTDSQLGVLPQSALRRVYGRCAIAQSATLIGNAQRAMAFALEHIMLRKQFGKLLAEFQAVQHQAADMYRVVDVAQLFLAEAIDRCGEDSMLEVASCCKAWANDAACQASATSHQLMGGTGYMQETDLHLLTTLALRGQYEFGSADYHREIIADLVSDT